VNIANEVTYRKIYIIETSLRLGVQIRFNWMKRT